MARVTVGDEEKGSPDPWRVYYTILWPFSLTLSEQGSAWSIFVAVVAANISPSHSLTYCMEDGTHDIIYCYILCNRRQTRCLCLCLLCRLKYIIIITMNGTHGKERDLQKDLAFAFISSSLKDTTEHAGS